MLTATKNLPYQIFPSFINNKVNNLKEEKRKKNLTAQYKGTLHSPNNSNINNHIINNLISNPLKINNWEEEKEK